MLDPVGSVPTQKQAAIPVFVWFSKEAVRYEFLIFPVLILIRRNTGLQV
jgi:hypothetical protein